MKLLPFLTACILILAIACQNSENPKGEGEEEAGTAQISNDAGLHYMEYGPGDGVPVFYFHGFPGSHKDIHMFNGAEWAEKYDLRIIAVNRPGYSDSQSRPGRSLSDWPVSISKLADQLGIEKFSILGVSGGAPFALSCASAIPDRIELVVIVSGMGPADAPEAKKGKAMLIPKAPKLILKGMSKMVLKKPEKFEASLLKGFPEVDQVFLEDPKAKAAMMGTTREAFRSGYQGALEDAIIYKSAWGFELSEIDQTIIMWHGGKDENVKIETAEFVIETLPHCTPHIIAGEGHLSLLYKHAEEILSAFH